MMDEMYEADRLTFMIDLLDFNAVLFQAMDQIPHLINVSFM